MTIDGASTDTNSLRGNVFYLAAGDTSANMVFNTGTQGGVSNSGTSFSTVNSEEVSGTTDAPDGSKIDFYSVNGSYTTTFLGTETVASGAFSLSETLTVGGKIAYQITESDGTSYPFALAGIVVSAAPTGLDNFGIIDVGGNLYAVWDTVSSASFDHFEIWYGLDQSDVEGRTGTATEWDNDDDSALATVSTTDTTIIGPDTGTAGQTFYAKIWAYATSGANSTDDTASYFTGVAGGGGGGGGVSGGGSSGSSGSSSSGTGSSATSASSNANDNPIARIQAEEEAEAAAEAAEEGTSATEEEAEIEETSQEELTVNDTTDTDGDGLTNSEELKLGTNIGDIDSDNDGLSDGLEVNAYKTNPLKIDTDGDGFADKYEIFNLKSDPNDICDPGNADFSEEQQAVCDKKAAEEAAAEAKAEEEAKKAEEALTEEKLEVDEKVVEDIVEDIEEEIKEEAGWSKRHFKNLMKIEAMKAAYSNSDQIRLIIDEFVKNPELPIGNGEAMAVAMAVFDEDLFDDGSMLKATDEEPFIERGFEVGILNTHVNPSFNSETSLKRGDALRLMFRVSGLKLEKTFGLDLFDNFGVKESTFSDVNMNNPALPYILFFQGKQLLQGYADGTFRSSEFMNRAEFVKLITLFHQEQNK